MNRMNEELQVKVPLAREASRELAKTTTAQRDAALAAMADALIERTPEILEANAADVAASFQKTVVETLVEKTMDAASYCGAKKIAVAGGVSANSGLAAAMSAACADKGYAFYRPDPILCTDNGAMIGCRAYYMALDGRFADLTLNAKPALPITSD